MHRLDIIWMLLGFSVIYMTAIRAHASKNWFGGLDDCIESLQSNSKYERIYAAWRMLFFALIAGQPYSGHVMSWAIPVLKKELVD